MLQLAWLTVGLAGPPRVAVFGGSGFVGSRVCRELINAGCGVVSISRVGKPPAWAAGQGWSEKVSWRSADALAASAMPCGRIDAAVSCVGNMRPAPEWDGFFGLHWKDGTMMRENGEVTERIAEAAHRAGARRFVYLSVCSSKKWAYGGALEGYIDGKLAGEAAVRRVYGDESACIVGPSLVYGGGRFAGPGKLYAAVGNSFAARGQIKFFKWLKGNAATGYGPQDAAGEVALTPPCDVEDVAKAVAACLLDTVPEGMRRRHVEQQRIETEIRQASGEPGEPSYGFTYVDGTDQIVEVAAAAGTGDVLAAAARAGGARAAEAAEAAEAEGPASDALDAANAAAQEDALWQSASAYGAPLEGALVGFRPLLYPWPPALALVGAFGGAILAGQVAPPVG